MVEAGILAPIFAMMMMLNIYLCGIYETKYRSVMTARYETFSYASNACSASQTNVDWADMPPAIQQAGGGSLGQPNGTGTNPNPSIPSGQTPSGGNVDPGTPPAGATKGLLLAKGQSTLEWNYSPTYRFNDTGSGPKVIESEGTMMCNTPPPAGMNVISYITGLIQTL